MSGKKWGWTITLAISAIGLITSVAALVIQSALSVVGLVGNIVIIALAMKKLVKAQFGGDSTRSKPT